LAPVVVFENQVLGKESPETTVEKVKFVLAGGSLGGGFQPEAAQEETATA
jgi:hypothetical protein